jgi:hypothetical protein
MLDGRDGNPRVADGVTGTMGTPSMKVSVTKLRDAKERNMQINVTRVFAALAALALIFVAVLPARVSAAGSHGLPIDTPAEAHEAVLETGAPFGDFAFLGDGLIGASQYYEVKGEPGSAASWIVIYTYGWGDCPAGCISRHTFVYQVDPVTGEVRFDRQEGEALPAEAPEALKQLEASGGAPVVITPIDATVPAASDAPATEDPDWAAMYEQWYEDFVAGLEPCAPDADPADPALMTCLLPDGSVAGPMDGGESGADDGWISELPKIILAVLLVWIGGAALVGWRKSRAS